MTAGGLQVQFQVHDAGFDMIAEVLRIGSDTLIAIRGGDVPHIGTVTTSISGGEPHTVSFPSHDDRLHHDGVLAERLLERLDGELQGTCVVTAGVHIDGVTQAQLTAAPEMAARLGSRIAAWLRDHPVTTREPVYTSNRNDVTRQGR
jgi:hypothetical protein